MCALLGKIAASVSKNHRICKLSSNEVLLYMNVVMSNKYDRISSIQFIQPQSRLNFLPRKFTSVYRTYSTLVIREKGYGSKYHPPSPIDNTETRLRKIFFEQKHFSAKEWDDLKSQLLSEIMLLNNSNFDSIVMNVLLGSNNKLLASSFMQYLKERKLKPNFVTCMKYMSLCGRNVDLSCEEEILSAFEKVKEIACPAPVLDAVTVDCIVQGLCATSRWRESFEYFKKLHNVDAFGDTQSALVCAALRNNEESLAWEILNTWFKPYQFLHQRIFRTYMKFIMNLCHKNHEEADGLLVKVLDFVQKREIVIKFELAKDLEKYFLNHPLSWEVKSSKINKLAECIKCKQVLQSEKLTREEFQHLQSSFYEKVLKKSDIFLNTTTEEFRKFRDFVNRNKPFDIVLDGLNAAHRESAIGGESRKLLAVQLLKVVNRISMTRKRILVLGRLHMRQWPRPIMAKIATKAEVFFTNNASEDDPFVLYAALASGPDTLFVSSDLMRDHMARLNDVQLIQLFRRWQRSHQVYVHDSELGPVFEGPLKHQICIQGNMKDGWHIPYDDEFILDPYEVLNNWLCIQRS